MKHLTIGRIVLVRMLSQWRSGVITANSGRDVTVLVDGRSVHIHSSVIRRDLRVGR